MEKRRLTSVDDDRGHRHHKISSRRFVYVDFKVKRRHDAEVIRKRNRESIKAANRPGMVDCHRHMQESKKTVVVGGSCEPNAKIADTCVVPIDSGESTPVKTRLKSVIVPVQRHVKDDSSKRKKNRVCWKCREPGHQHSSCKKPRVVSMTRKQCIICKIRGHIADDCPTEKLKSLLLD